MRFFTLCLFGLGVLPLPGTMLRAASGDQIQINIPDDAQILHLREGAPKSAFFGTQKFATPSVSAGTAVTQAALPTVQLEPSRANVESGEAHITLTGVRAASPFVSDAGINVDGNALPLSLPYHYDGGHVDLKDVAGAFPNYSTPPTLLTETSGLRSLPPDVVPVVSFGSSQAPFSQDVSVPALAMAASLVVACVLVLAIHYRRA